MRCKRHNAQELDPTLPIEVTMELETSRRERAICRMTPGSLTRVSRSSFNPCTSPLEAHLQRG